MRKKIIILCIFLLGVFPINIYASSSQSDLNSAVENASKWFMNNSDPMNAVGSIASDYYIMSLSANNNEYSFNTYLSALDKKPIESLKDKQRRLLVSTACGYNDSKLLKELSNSTFKTVAELSSAIISFDCGGYNIESKDNLIFSLLAMQQSDGSFGDNIVDTATAVIALSTYKDYTFKTNNKNTSTFTVQNSILNATLYFENIMDKDHGFGSVRNNAYVIMALDSISIDVDNDPTFSSNNTSPLSNLMKSQKSNGSFNDSADDTAFALCAVISHLNALSGKSCFFSFNGTLAEKPIAENNIVIIDETKMNESKETKSEDLAVNIKPSPTPNIKETETQDINSPTVQPEPGNSSDIRGYIYVGSASLVALIALIGFVFTLKYPDKINRFFSKKNKK